MKVPKIPLPSILKCTKRPHPFDVPIIGFMRFFSVLGFAAGILSPFFWVLMYIGYCRNDDEHKFFNDRWYRRVYIYGVFCVVIIGSLFISVFISVVNAT